MNGKIISLPISNTKVSFSDDTTEDGFKKVTLQICKAGYVPSHGLIIEGEAITDAQETVLNRPLLCAYEIDENGDKTDFKGHEMDYKIVKENGSYTLKIVYIEQPVGTIPESCGYRIETINDEEWFVVDALLYSDYCEDAVRILEENDGEKSVSMEITVLESEVDKDGIVHIKKFKFKGVTLLGAKHNPAIKGANIKSFTQDDVFAQKYSKILEHINNINNSNSSEGGNEMGDEARQAIIDKFQHLSENKQFQAIVENQELDNVALEKELFSLSNADLHGRIREALEEIKYSKKYYWSDEEYEYNKYWLCDVLMEDNIVIAEDNEHYGKYYGIPFTKNGDKVVLDTENIQRYIRGDWRVFDEGEVEPAINPLFEYVEKVNIEQLAQVKTEFENVNNELAKVKATNTDLQCENSNMSEELKVLKEFEENIKKTEKEAEINEVMENFSELANVEGFEKINEVRFELPIEDLITKLKVLAYDNGIVIKKSKKAQQDNSYVKTGLNFSKGNEELTEAEKRYGKDIKKYLNI